MISFSLSQFLALFMWFPLAVLIFMVLLIARFYERFSNRRTYFQLYGIPIVGFSVVAVRTAATGTISGDLLADLAMIISGTSLLVLVLWLYWSMVIRQKPD